MYTIPKRLKYEKLGESTISINLHNGYTVIAIASYNHENSLYTTSLYLKENSVDFLDLIDYLEPFTFTATYKTVSSALLKYIDSLLSNNLFDKAIARYEYMLKCFDIGNEFYENKGHGEN